MSALAEALVAAQRRALSAMEKQYVAGKIDADEARMVMELIGETDAVDQERLLASLNAIRLYGAAVPPESNGATKRSDPATDKALREGAVWGELPAADEVRRLCLDVMQTAYTP